MDPAGSRASSPVLFRVLASGLQHKSMLVSVSVGMPRILTFGWTREGGETKRGQLQGQEMDRWLDSSFSAWFAQPAT